MKKHHWFIIRIIAVGTFLLSTFWPIGILSEVVMIKSIFFYIGFVSLSAGSLCIGWDIAHKDKDIASVLFFLFGAITVSVVGFVLITRPCN
jgi:hypothetical protein